MRIDERRSPPRQNARRWNANTFADLYAADRRRPKRDQPATSPAAAAAAAAVAAAACGVSARTRAHGGRVKETSVRVHVRVCASR